MKKSVFFRQIILIVLSGVVITVILSSVLYMIIVRYSYIRMRSQELHPLAVSIAELVADEITGDTTGGERFSQVLRLRSYGFFGANLYIISDTGEIITGAKGGESVYEPNPPPEFEAAPDSAILPDSAAIPGYDTPPKYISEGGLIPEDVINSAFALVQSAGDITTITKSDENSLEYLVAGVPVYVEDGFAGAILLAQPVTELSEKMNGLNETLLASAMVAFFIMLWPAYFWAKRMAKPIGEIRDVSQAMSQGDFSVRANESYNGEMGELARSINDFADKSEKLEQTRRDYVANISHELRTPIASIRAMSETLQDGMLDSDEKKQRYYNHIFRESLRLSRLVDELLELSRLQSHGVTLKKELTDVNPVLEAAAVTFEQIALDAGIEFCYSSRSYKPVMTNPDRIEQVLIILLDNAVKHTPEGGRINLDIADCGSHLEVSVSDSGSGIDIEDLPHIFERFYKADKAHSSGGTGLGLSIANEVIKVLGETITAESLPGHGSCFTFTIHR